MRTRIYTESVDALFNSPSGPVALELARRAVAVERLAKRLCPVDTGHLRASINWRLARDARGLLAIVGTNVTYAPFVEFGTRFAHAQPFLRPALEAAGGHR